MKIIEKFIFSIQRKLLFEPIQGITKSEYSDKKTPTNRALLP
jgi:hypothetical protein